MYAVRGSALITAAVIASLLSVAHAKPVKAQTVAYFGPMQVHIASSVSDPTPLYYSQVVYQHADEVSVSGSCIAVLNSSGAGSNPGNPRVEMPGAVVYEGMIGTYGGGAAFAPSDSATCFILLRTGSPSGAQGTCMLIDGHVSAAPDLFGQTWVADHITPCH